MVGSLVVWISRDLDVIEPEILIGIRVSADSFVNISVQSNKIDTRKCCIKISDSIYDESAEVTVLQDLMIDGECDDYGWRKLLHVF